MLVFTWFFAACLLGVANFWQWGHNGYNGAAFVQAARNSLRFHLFGEAQYYMGVAAPPPAEVYTHHPMALHVHLMAMLKLFGYHEWAARLVPAGYSFAGLLLLFAIVRRYWGKAEALGAATVYALVPLHLIFANMIDHEQGSIFWCLLFVFAYARWLKTGAVRFALLCFAAVSMAVQFDWPGYYIALFVAIHALLYGVFHQTRLLQWRREYTFIPIFSLVVLTNAALFFGYIYHLRGSFDEMLGAFRSRSSTPEGVWHRLWERSVDMYGYLPIALLALWLLALLVRIPRRKLQLRDIFPVFFLLAQVVHSVLFRQAGYVHSYWTYHAGPAIAIAGGAVLAGLVQSTSRASAFVAHRLARGSLAPWTGRIATALTITVCAAVLGPLLVFQARYVRKQLAWGFHKGFGAYVEPYDDQFLDIRWVQDVARRYNRANAEFHLFPAARWRIEWTAYLDAPWSALSSVSHIPTQPVSGTKHQIYLIDLQAVPDPSKLVPALAAHPTIVYDRRFLVIDASSGTPTFAAYQHQTLRPAWWWRWLVNPIHPPLRWIPDAQTDLVRAQLRPNVRILTSKVFGGPGGAPGAWSCPEGYLLTAMSGTVATNDASLASIRPACRLITERGALASPQALLQGPTFGARASKAFHLDCGPAGVIVGLFGRQGKVVHALGLVCATAGSHRDPTSNTLAFDWRETWRTEPVGGREGTAFEFGCGTGSGAWGFHAASGVLVDAVGVSCGEVDSGFLATGEAIAREDKIPER